MHSLQKRLLQLLHFIGRTFDMLLPERKKCFSLLFSMFSGPQIQHLPIGSHLVTSEDMTLFVSKRKLGQFKEWRLSVGVPG